MPVVNYHAYTTNISNYDLGDNTYNRIVVGDDNAITINLITPFVFNNQEYSLMYINSNGLINFTQLTIAYNYNNITSQYAGFYIFGTDLLTPDLPYFIRYKEFSDKFVLIYNNYFLGQPSNLFQVKITLYLKNHANSGDVIADFGTVNNSNTNSQFGVSFGTRNQTNIIQNVNFINYTSNNRYTFTYPNSPNQNVTNNQSSYSNKQFVISVVKNIICFKEHTKILTDKGYIPIQDLRKGDLVKTLKHDYKPINMIGKREIYHPANKERIKDQLYICSQDNFDEIFEPLIITGCHSILLDSFISEEQIEKVKEVNGQIYITDNKYRIPACVEPRTSVYETPGNYTIYHLALENDDYYMNYGIYANGLLVETCSKRYLKELSNMTLIE